MLKYFLVLLLAFCFIVFMSSMGIAEVKNKSSGVESNCNDLCFIAVVEVPVILSVAYYGDPFAQDNWFEEVRTQSLLVYDVPCFLVLNYVSVVDNMILNNSRTGGSVLLFYELFSPVYECDVGLTNNNFLYVDYNAFPGRDLNLLVDNYDQSSQQYFGGFTNEINVAFELTAGGLAQSAFMIQSSSDFSKVAISAKNIDRINSFVKETNDSGLKEEFDYYSVVGNQL